MCTAWAYRALGSEKKTKMEDLSRRLCESLRRSTGASVVLWSESEKNHRRWRRVVGNWASQEDDFRALQADNEFGFCSLWSGKPLQDFEQKDMVWYVKGISTFLIPSYLYKQNWRKKRSIKFTNSLKFHTCHLISCFPCVIFFSSIIYLI
jgi:hypothetical protein